MVYLGGFGISDRGTSKIWYRPSSVGVLPYRQKDPAGDHAVGRVIARPFIGSGNGNYTRTPRRHDFSLEPTGTTILDQVIEAGQTVLAVGKIKDIFAGRSIFPDFVYTQNNAEGIERTLEYMDRDFEGLCFTNLVDTDMIYGHRRDIDGYAEALSYFDSKLPEILAKLREDDILIVTADCRL